MIHEGKIAKYPIYTGNGFRGLLHRELAFYFLTGAEDLSQTNYHLNAAGGGSNFQAQTLEIVRKIRGLNPIVSLFGASLAVSGRLINTEFTPTQFFWSDSEKHPDQKYSRLIKRAPYAKVDDLIGSGTEYASLVSDDLREIYNETVIDTQEERANERKNKSETKTKKETIQSWNEFEYIVAGTELMAYTSSKKELTQLEKGALLKGLSLAVRRQLGGFESKGYGVAEFTIESIDENGIARNVITSRKNEANIFKPIVETFYNTEEREAVEAFETFVKNRTKENYNIDEILVAKK